MKTLCTFSGKYGDILWSLPTAKHIAEKIVGDKVDFGIMPQYKSLIPLLMEQSYINTAFDIENWICTGSPHGDQPWQPPADAEDGYDKVYHLGYRSHPGIGGIALPLIDFIAHQQDIKLDNPVPFLSVKEKLERPGVPFMFVGMAFNEQHAEEKKVFADIIKELDGQTVEGMFIYISDLTKLTWLDAALRLETCDLFVGDRSANWVLAKGFDKTCVTFEPNHSRHATGPFGKIFGCPYGKAEIPVPGRTLPQFTARFVNGFITNRIKEMEKV